MTAIRTAVVEDSPAYRESLSTLLRHAPAFEAAEIFPSAEAALRHARDRIDAGEDLGWDLLLMDIELPRMDGISAARLLHELAPGLPIVMLTVFEDPRVILRAISAGARGYVLKKSSARELLAQLRSVVEGGAPLSPAVASTVLELVRKMDLASGGGDPATRPRRLGLTERELDVLRCLVRGLTYAQSADDLGISEGTIRTHIGAIYRKLQVHSAAQAVRKALEEGLV